MAGTGPADPEQQAGIAVEQLEAEAQMSAGELGMDGDIGIIGRLRLPKILQAWHETTAA
jgi:hypothetical protein